MVIYVSLQLKHDLKTRKIKLNEFIADLWTYNGNIKIKDKRGKVHSIEDVADHNQFVPRDYDLSQ